MKKPIDINACGQTCGTHGKTQASAALYKNHRALGALATMVASNEDKAYAQEKGFYVLCQNGEGIDICNGAAFTPKAW